MEEKSQLLTKAYLDCLEHQLVVEDLIPFTMIRVCAWCVPIATQLVMRKKGFTLTHTVCPECRERFGTTLEN